MKKKAYVIILDGYGLGKHDTGDALFHGKTPYIDSLLQTYPFAQLKTHGKSVGLPEFQTGGSEVGHITIGAGREVKHLLTRINDQVENGKFFKNEKLIALMDKAKEKNRLHIIGLMSDGGIHSFQPHVYGVLDMAKKNGIENIFIHAITDGRDVGERTAKGYITELESKNIGTIATIGGRFFAMDRDNNLERTQKAFDSMTNVFASSTEKKALDEINEYYESSTDSDYYMPPVALCKEGEIRGNDVVININYRTDRMRQFSDTLVTEKISKENYGIFGPYCDGAIEPFHFGSIEVKNTLGEVVSKNGGTQLRISETEKFNHVTFFMSGQTKTIFEGENRILVPSPKCKSYAEKPEMSAKEQTVALKADLEKNDYNLIVQNYANADLVGHSGNLIAAEKAAETLDSCLKEIIPFALQKGYEVFVTADHGNAEVMLNEDGSPDSSHTQNFVPFVWISENSFVQKEKGTLQDIAPSVLSLLGIEIPLEMEGDVVFTKNTQENTEKK